MIPNATWPPNHRPRRPPRRALACTPGAPQRLARAIAYAIDLEFEEMSEYGQGELLAEARALLGRLGGLR